MTYQEALTYLESLINYEKLDNYDYKKSFRLDRMRSFTEILGNPQKDIPSIHVAGTKGKGSTAAIIHSILKNAKLKVGLYTSPHLVSFRERIRIGDELISEGDVSRFLDKIKDVLNMMRDDTPSFFEVYTALAYLYFKEKNVDFAVYEAGLGGRLDATNVIDPLVCVITPISYEHTQKLGNTLKEIAAEKGGIIKDRVICVSAPQGKEALETIADICDKRKARLIIVGRDILFEESDYSEEKEVFSIFGIFGEFPFLELKLLGSHQIINAAAAIGAVEALRFYGITIPFEAIRLGIEGARWEGRLEIVRRRPSVVLDGAQNRASANALTKAIRKIFLSENKRYDKLILVLGVSKDKDIIGILEEILPVSDSIILTKSKVAERALEPSRIKDLIYSNRAFSYSARDKDVVLTSSVEEALMIAGSKAKTEDLILVTGSLFVVGEAKSIYNL